MAAQTDKERAKEQPDDGGMGLTTQILIALVLGVLVGWMFPTIATSLSFIGEIFMAALKMLIMPLILATMIVGVASLGTPKELGRLGGRAIAYFLTTTALAVVVGLVLVNVMKPGQTTIPTYIKSAIKETIPSTHKGPLTNTPQIRKRIEVAFQQFLLGDDKNPKELQVRAATLAAQATLEILAAARQKSDARTPQAMALNAVRAEMIIARVGMRRSLQEAAKMRQHSKQKGPPLTVDRFLRMQITKILENPFRSLATDNVLGVIVFSILLGLILVSMGDRGKPAIILADSLNEAMMRFVNLIMKMTPIGVFSLMAYQIANSGLDILILLGKYMLCVVLALAVHGLLVLPTMLMIVGRRSPLRFFSDMRTALGIAFSTSSSSATLPVSIDVIERNANVRPKVARFVLPLGATVNMDGTALYEAIAALFIAQIYGIDLGLGPQILIFMTAALAAIGAAGIPSAGTVTMVMVLSAVGLPLGGIGLILAVDRLLDMCRTTVNVWGDAIGAAILDRYEVDEDAHKAEG